MQIDHLRINDPKVISKIVVDCRESLVSVLDLDRIFLLSQTNLKFGTVDGDSNNPIVRLTVKKMLCKVLEKLDSNYGILFIEGYRRYDYQKSLFQHRVSGIVNNEKVSVSEAKIKASQFVSDPDVYSPHVTGGAIDLGILHLESMKLLDMGNDFVYDDTAMIDCGRLSSDQIQNRKMLTDLMTSCGFINYPFEWWHWSYGDKYWAFVNNEQSAIYDSVI